MVYTFLHMIHHLYKMVYFKKLEIFQKNLIKHPMHPKQLMHHFNI